MKQRFASGKRLLKRRRISKIACNPLRIEICDIAQIAGRPHQQTQLRSLRNQSASNMASQESSRTGDKGEHLALSVWRSALPTKRSCSVNRVWPNAKS